MRTTGVARMATQAAATSGYIADFAAKLLSEREVIPRAQIIVSQISEFFPDAGVVLYLLEGSGSEPHWRLKAARGNVSVPKHLFPRGLGSLGTVCLKR